MSLLRILNLIQISISRTETISTTATPTIQVEGSSFYARFTAGITTTTTISTPTTKISTVLIIMRTSEIYICSQIPWSTAITTFEIIRASSKTRRIVRSR